jgi:hypothetical protein
LPNKTGAPQVVYPIWERIHQYVQSENGWRCELLPFLGKDVIGATWSDFMGLRPVYRPTVLPAGWSLLAMPRRYVEENEIADDGMA